MVGVRGASLALLACLLSSLSHPSLASNLTTCGNRCETDKSCGDICPWCGKESYCRPACGKSCKTDDDCGVPQDYTYNCPYCIQGRCEWATTRHHCKGLQTQLPPGGKPPQPGHPDTPPLLPSAWNATVEYLNYTDGTKTTGRSWYDYRFRAMRLDFPAPCPMVQSPDPKVNDGPCSIIFYKGHNYYFYPESDLCCRYDFPGWAPNVFQKVNASFLGTIRLPLGQADIWDSTYACPWLPGLEPKRVSPAFPLPTGLTIQRRAFVDRETGNLLGMNETLTATMSTYTSFTRGEQEESLFTDPIKGCINIDHKPKSLQYCRWYYASGRLGHYGYE